MGTGYTRNDTSNNIADGNIINASDLDGEFDALQTAFDASSGHTHDGTTAEGAPIEVIGPSQDVVATASVLRPKTDNTVDLGTSSLEYKDLFLDGTAHIDTLDVDENASITGTLGVTGAVTANAGVIIDNITIDGTEIDLSSGDLTVDVAGDIVLDADGGDVLLKDAGTQYGSLTNSSGNLIVKSGSTTALTFSGANVTAAGNVTIDGNLDVTGTFDLSDSNFTNAGNIQLDSISGDADTDTSITFSGSDVITVATGGTTSFTVDASQNILMNAAQKVQFRDTALTINSSTDGQLDIDADTEVEITAPTVDINASTAVTVSNDLKLDSDAAVLGFGADNDVTLTHVADTGLLLNGTSVIQFNDASQKIGAPNATTLDIDATDEIELNATLVDVNANLDVSGTYTGAGLMTTGGNIVIPDAGTIGSASDTDAIAIGADGDVTLTQDLELQHDAATLSFGADNDVVLTHVADTGLLLNSTMALQFNDASQFINAPSATVLDINATDEVELNATLVDVNANLDVSGTYTGGGLMTTGGNIVIPDAGNIGSASDTDAIAIASDGQVTLTQTLTGTAANFSGVATATTFEPDGDTAAGDNAAIGYTAAEGLILTGQGSTNDVTIKNDADADVLEIPTGTTNVTIAGNLGVGGTVTGTGTSVFASLDISGDIDVDGTTNLDAVDIDGAVDFASTTAHAGNATFADNAKAVFGAGSDLQIYHDGSNSYITDAGSGSLYLRGSNQVIIESATGEKYFIANANADTNLYYDNAAKLATTATGVDVTGTAVTDGLTVAGNVSVDGGTIKLDGNYPTGTSNVALGDAALDSLTSGAYNTAVGHNAGTALTSGDANTAIGFSSLQNNTTGNYNVGIGKNALDSNTTASNNTALGYYALQSNTAANNTALGYGAAYQNTSGTSNTALGYYALQSNTTASGNVSVGYQSLYSNTTGGNNVGVGFQAAYNTTTGSHNTALGVGSLFTNATGVNNLALGNYSLYSNTASYNFAIGYATLYNNTSGTGNTAVGYYSAYTNSTGTNNATLGQQALYYNTTGASNTSIGYLSMLDNTTGSNNVGVGEQALSNNTTANNNTAVGYQAGYGNSTGTQNVSVGSQSMLSSTTGSNNVSVGMNALFSNTTASNNTAVGYQAGYSNTTGTQNTFVGYYSGYSNTTGNNSAFFGEDAGVNNTTGNYNVGLGSNALRTNTTASDNTAVGYEAGYSITTGIRNVALGYKSGFSATTPNQNTFVGAWTGYSVTTGGGNTFVGGLGASGSAGCGYYMTTGSNNTIIGGFTGDHGGLDIRTASNYIVLSDGDGNIGLVSEPAGTYASVQLAGTTSNSGSGSTTTARNFAAYKSSDGDMYHWIANSKSSGASSNLYLQRADTGNPFVYFISGTTNVGTISTNGSSTSYNTSSDHRLKENVVELTGATDRLKQLEPKRFNFIANADTTVDGFMAHEVQTVVPEAISGTHNEVDDDGNPVYQGIDQSKLVPLLVATIKELEARITALEKA